MAVTLTPDPAVPRLVELSCTGCEGSFVVSAPTQRVWDALVAFAAAHDAECVAVAA